MNISLLRTRIAIALFLWIGLGSWTYAQSEKGILWKISGEDLKEPSYLLGTYHLLTDKFVNELPEVKKAFSKTKGVVVEMVIDSSKLGAMTMMAIMPGKKISEMISAEDFKLISAELERTIEVSLSAMDQLKPISVMVFLTLAYAQEQNAEVLKKYPGVPMDAHLAALGKKEQKQITQLETMEEQMALLYNQFPLEEQARQLVAFIKQKDLMIQSQATLLNHYLSKDLKSLYEFSESMPKDFGDSDFLLKDRNEKWVQVIPELMRKQSQFIAVGALHLPGPDGVISLLQKQGYTVKPVTK
jgi:uncharacterized protein YbaP (TraB family)